MHRHCRFTAASLPMHRTRPMPNHCHPRLLKLLLATLIAVFTLTARGAAEPALAQSGALITPTLPISATPALTSTLPVTAATPFSPLEGLRTPLATASVVEYATSFAEVECPFVAPWDQEIICGELEVPENRAAADSDGVSLFVIILKSFGPPQTDPVLVLADGPGNEGTSLRHLFYNLQDAPFRSNRDIILFDPRGAGYSTPSLNCPEVDEGAPVDAALVASYQACYDRLQDEGHDLSAYSAATQVADIADLAQVLGIGSLNIYATGYGTRVATLLADRRPNLVRSMVLDGVLPVDANAPLEAPLNFYATLQRVAQDCSMTPACNAAYPALEARLLEVIDRYNRNPAPKGFGSGDEILAHIARQLGQGGRVLPALITALFDEDFDIACALAPPVGGCREPLSAAAAIQAAQRRLEEGPAESSPNAPQWQSLLPSGANAAPQIETLSWLMRTLGFATPAALSAHLETLPIDEVAALLAEAPVPNADVHSEGLAASAWCAEDAPFFTRVDLRRVAARLPLQFGTLPLEEAALMQAVCSFWEVTPQTAADKLIQPITAPVLLVGGSHDAQTPPAWARPRCRQHGSRPRAALSRLQPQHSGRRRPLPARHDAALLCESKLQRASRLRRRHRARFRPAERPSAAIAWAASHGQQHPYAIPRNTTVITRGPFMSEHVVGVDLGGTQIRAVLADRSGTVIARDQRMTDADEGPDAVIERIVASVRTVIGEEPISAIGIGAPGPVDPHRGIVLMAANLPGWSHVDLRNALYEPFGAPVYVGNDANLAGLAEHHYGAGRGVDHMIYITQSTGIGLGIIVDGHMLVGAQGLAAESGHNTIDLSQDDAALGIVGTMEGSAAGPDIAARAQRRLHAGAQSVAVELAGGDIARVSPHILCKAAGQGDPFTLAEFAETGRYMGVGITNLLHTFNPQRIVIGGSVWMHCRSYMEESMWATIRARCPVAGVLAVARHCFGGTGR